MLVLFILHDPIVSLELSAPIRSVESWPVPVVVARIEHRREPSALAVAAQFGVLACREETAGFAVLVGCQGSLNSVGLAFTYRRLVKNPSKLRPLLRIGRQFRR